MAEPATDETAKPAAQDTAKTAPETPAPVLKDKPRPFGIFRHESSKTTAVEIAANAERKVVDDKFNGLSGMYQPTLEAYNKELAAGTAERITVRQETVEKLTAEVGATEQVIADLQKKLVEQREKLWRSQDSLRGAKKDLAAESAKVAAETKAAMKARKKELGVDIAAAKKQKRAVYKETGKALRREHWNTFTRTTKEAVAYFPDLALRFARAAKRATGEALHVFNRSAQKANEGFKEPTVFSIKRDEPLPETKKPEAKKPEPKAPAGPAA